MHAMIESQQQSAEDTALAMVALPSHTAGAATTTTLVVAPTSASPGDDVSISVNFDQTSDDGELVFVSLG